LKMLVLRAPNSLHNSQAMLKLTKEDMGAAYYQQDSIDYEGRSHKTGASDLDNSKYQFCFCLSPKQLKSFRTSLEQPLVLVPSLALGN
jgi:hypothetical protein